MEISSLLFFFFAFYLVDTNTYEKCHAIHDGLHLSSNNNIMGIYLEMDSKSMATMVCIKNTA